MHLAGEREAHDARVVNDDDDDRERAEKIEARLALAIRKARVDRRFGSWRANARNLAAQARKSCD
jgi:hypothetical protein